MFDAITNYFSNLTPEHYFFFLFAIVAIASALEQKKYLRRVKRVAQTSQIAPEKSTLLIHA